MKSVEVDVEALDELRDAVAWYDNKQDGVGQRFGEAVAATLKALPGRRLKPLPGFKHLDMMFVDVGDPWPYRLLVIELPTSLWVVAVAHGRRQPGYWMPRLAR